MFIEKPKTFVFPSPGAGFSLALFPSPPVWAYLEVK
jgi:hypothetical protein